VAVVVAAYVTGTLGASNPTTRWDTTCGRRRSGLARRFEPRAHVTNLCPGHVAEARRKAHDTSLAAPLGFVHRDVGLPDELVGGSPDRGTERDPMETETEIS
jgi:hypothetical protein